MTLEQKIDLLLQRGIVRTGFATTFVPENDSKGSPLGKGNCKAVVLRLNEFERNSTAGTAQAVEQIYYGDAARQEFELKRGINSDIIFCTDLEEVFIRMPVDAAVADVQVQIMIYY